MKTFRIEPADPKEYTYIKGKAYVLHYMGGNTHIPENVASVLMRQRRNNTVFLVDIDNPTSHLSNLRWIGGGTNIARETAIEISSFPDENAG